MSCDHQFFSDHLIDYIEGGLEPALRRRCEEILADCEQCRDTHARALEFYRLSSQWHDEAVPAWHRMRHAVQPRVQAGNWLGWSALATSCLTLLVVLFQPHVDTSDGFVISFGDHESQARVQAQVARQLEAFREENDKALDTRLADFSDRENSTNRLLLSDWLDRSRSERRQDLEFLMSNWESQRFQDRRQVDERLTSLARNQIDSNQTINEMLKSAEYR